MMYIIEFYDINKEVQLRESAFFNSMEEASRYAKDKAKQLGFETYSCELLRHR